MKGKPSSTFAAWLTISLVLSIAILFVATIYTTGSRHDGQGGWPTIVPSTNSHVALSQQEQAEEVFTELTSSERILQLDDDDNDDIDDTFNTNSTTMQPSSTSNPTLPPTTNPFNGMQGALVTRDCIWDDDYPYAVDIYWSCGDEKFDQPLRLHTWKRHSRSHQEIFNDQFITFRQQQLWFDGYDKPRCIVVDEETRELGLASSASSCSIFDLVAARSENDENTNRFLIVDLPTNGCVGLGRGATCDSDRSTGGSECGGRDHRFLPIEIVDDCNSSASSLSFQFETQAQDCANDTTERPESACFP